MKMIYKKYKYIFRCFSILCFILFVVEDTNGQTADTTIQDKDSIPAGSSKIAVAYGEQENWKNTSAISTVSGDDLRKTFAPTLSNTLYGRLPGFTVIQGSGEPGYDAPSMFGRGISSYNGSRILTFVDGFESPFDQLTPDEIESISFLKDAAATALYGIRGANGVLLVTTKKGFIGKPEISFNVQTGWQSPLRIVKPLDATNYASLYNEALQNEGKALRYSADDIEAYRSGSDKYFHPNVNWQDEVLKKTTPISNYDFNFRGGTKAARYFVLLNVLQNEGLYKNTDPTRKTNSNAFFLKYNFRSNVDVDVTKRLTASLYLGGRIEDRTTPGGVTAGDLFNSLSLIPPNAFPVTNPDGTYGGTSIYNNPVAGVLSTGLYNNHNRNFQAIFKMSHKLDMLTEGLSMDGSVGFTNFFAGSSTKSKKFAMYSLSKNIAGDTLYSKIGNETSITSSEGYNDQWRRSNLQARLLYDRTFGDSDIDAMLMFLQDQYVIDGNNMPYAYRNLAGKVSYSYKKKYIAELSASYSGSENFQKGNRYGLFPAISAGWIVSEENFLQNSPWLNYLKMKASYGVTGNDQIASRRFMYDQYYVSSGSYFFGDASGSRSPINEGNLANTDVTWEKRKMANFGIELTAFNRLNFQLDVFDEVRYDIIAEPVDVVPGFVGVLLPAYNQGKVQNRGFEASLGYTKSTGDFLYNIQGSAWYARNKILAMSEVEQPYSYLNKTGRSVNQPFGLVNDGFYEEADFQGDGSLVAGLPIPQFGPVQPGDLKYKDQNNDDVINVYDYQPIGKSTLPEWSFGLETGFTYKGFKVEAFFHAVTNRSVYLNGTNYWAFQNDAGVTSIALDRWTPETAHSAKYPRLSTTTNNNNYRLSDFWQRDGSFIKLRSLEVGYSFPKSVVNVVLMKDAYVYVNGVNMFSIDKVDIADPENLSGYPSLKSYNIGIRVKL